MPMKHPDSVRKEAIRLMVQDGLSANQVAKALARQGARVAVSTIAIWRGEAKGTMEEAVAAAAESPHDAREELEIKDLSEDDMIEFPAIELASMLRSIRGRLRHEARARHIDAAVVDRLSKTGERIAAR